MAGTVEAHLQEKGIDLPEVAAPAGNYVPYVVSRGMVYISGQIPILDGQLRYTGKLGPGGLHLDDGYQAARLCALNVIAQVKAACDGDLDRVTRVVKLGGFVACTPDFTDQPKVINGASDLMAEVFGEAGRHARFAVGAPALPLDVAVELDGLFEIDG